MLIDAHIEQDIKDAMALGVDAFALNTNTVTASYAKDCITSMFTWYAAFPTNRVLKLILL